MIGVALSSLLVASLIAVGASQAVSRGIAAEPSTNLAADPITISGIVGTEKGPFFADPQVKQRLAAFGLTVNVDTAGSRQMAATKNLKDYDFAFPSSAPVADKIIRADKPISTNAPFYSPYTGFHVELPDGLTVLNYNEGFNTKMTDAESPP